MVYLPPSETDEERRAREQQQLAPPVGVIGAGTPVTLPTAGEGRAPTGPPPGGATTFPDITSYLEKNRPAAERLSQRLAQEITKRGETAREAISEAGQQFGQYAAGETVEQRPELLESIRQAPQTVTSSPEQLAEFRRQLEASYGGPSALEESQYYAPILAPLQSAQEARELAPTEAGRAELLSQLYPGRRINPLDVGLLQTAGMEPILTAGESLGDLESRLAAASQTAREQATSARETNIATQAALREALGEAPDIFETGLDERVEAARAAVEARNEELRQMFGQIVESPQSPGLTPEALADLDVSQEDWDEIQKRLQNLEYYSNYRNQILGDVNIPVDTWQEYMTYQSPEAEVTRENVATAEDYARLAALNELTGAQSQFISHPEQAGTAPTELTGLKGEDFSNILRTDFRNYPAPGASQDVWDRRALALAFIRTGRTKNRRKTFRDIYWKPEFGEFDWSLL